MLVFSGLRGGRWWTALTVAACGFTLWRLEQAFTSALGPVFKSNPQRFVSATMALQGLLGEAAGVRPEEAFQAQSA